VSTPSETLVSAANVDQLDAIVDAIAERGGRECRLIAAVEGVDPEAMVSLERLVAASRAAIARGRARSIQVRVAGLPRCLLESDAEQLDTTGPAGTPTSSCLFEARCGLSERCPGLAHPYIARYGWHEQQLRPSPRERPWTPPAPRFVGAHPAWLALLGPDPTLIARVERVELDRRALRYHTRMPGGTGLVIELQGRDERRPALVRSRSFNVCYTRVEGRPDPEALARFVAPFAAAIVRNDDGALSLDPRS
jgi:hypothetical protein